MDKHLGLFKTANDILEKDIFIERITELSFTFPDYDIELHQITSIAVTHDKNLIIRLYMFNPELYNAFVQKNNILLITEKGKCVDPKDTTELHDYKTYYKNYQFKSVSGSKGNSDDNEWIFVLEKIDEE